MFGDGGQQAGTVACGRQHQIHFSRYSFDTLIVRTAGRPPGFHRQGIETVLAEMEAYDAVFSDSPELVLLLRYIRNRRNRPPLPWLVNEVDQFAASESVRDYVLHHYGEDPLPEALRAPEVLWFCITPGLRSTYRNLGLRMENYFYMPIARASLSFFFPETVALQDRLLRKAGLDPVDAPVPEGCILAIGSHERDYACLSAALRPTGMHAEILCNLKQQRRRPSGPLRWHDTQPAPVYLECLRRARIVVLPLRDGGRALGQLSCAFPMRLGKAIIGTAVPSLAAHIIPGRTGLSYPAGDAGALRKQILALIRDPKKCAALGKAARRREVSLSRTAGRAIRQIMERLGAMAAQRRIGR